VWLAASDGKRVVAATKWNRGREYTVQFAAEKIGTYQFVCSEHAPSMIGGFWFCRESDASGSQLRLG
jgi:plastocyanin